MYLNLAELLLVVGLLTLFEVRVLLNQKDHKGLIVFLTLMGISTAVAGGMILQLPIPNPTDLIVAVIDQGRKLIRGVI